MINSKDKTTSYSKEKEEFRTSLLEVVKDNALYNESEYTSIKLTNRSKFDHNFMLFNSIFVQFDISQKKWTINFELDSVQRILCFVNSKLSVLGYLMAIKSLTNTLKTFLPKYIEGSSVHFHFENEEERLDRFISFVQMRDEIEAVTGKKTYFNARDEIVMADIGLHFSRDSYERNDFEAMEMYDGRKVAWLSLRPGRESNSFLEDFDILNLINRITLQSPFSSVPDYNKAFKEKFNAKMEYTFFLHQNNHPKLDFYNEILKVNPNADLYDIFFLNTSFDDITDILDSPRPTAHDLHKSKVLKTLHGYYYLKKDDSLGYLSLEQYDQRKSKAEVNGYGE